MTIREQIEETEYLTLSPYATKARETKGREIKKPLCDIRTEFQRDRDKIIHSKSFRRLKHKTQVFISPEGDHYRTRLTHTLEVSQIGRTIARSLRLNEDLVEAISLGHDLGHTPFGHAGENALNILSPYGFRHNEQSVRVVDTIEKLNLTYEVRDGILHHTGGGTASTPEGKIIKFADRIAYINHDIDDAIRAGVLSLSSIPGEIIEVLGSTHSERISCMIKNCVKASSNSPEISMTGKVKEAMDALRKFMFDNVYVIGSDAKIEETKVYNIMEGLYSYYITHPEALPDVDVSTMDAEAIERCVCDYIAGMSDRYAIYVFNKLYIPSSWGHNGI
ncbi:MAG: deoxyguanosinetriphosphate triphosphohydrolase [Clostridia bacterium]|nr:deoxyguanosinetriphosphate triphosphohydrolase [Clostridia bacterium]